ncbi:DNA-binding transcriptional regulator, ArsR family [Rhizobium sp. NFR07]|uniref:ArsR/SmtB family transcription factor n=1 Tax=Rhizobium sp. NFR07 TaxID=1566262 RepID=UPI0008DF61F2|nr:metalloregulator ArsR/SmtB family transcription factor [Rhizobium sp. NFR07]SFB65033.1 DNA-binding transcriptional regulator, ArsR family [Rhizobium sp. NFR07]
MQDEAQAPFTFDPNEAANLLDLKSSPVRIEVLQRVTMREWDVNSLATDLTVSQSALSQHLSKLRAALLVTTRRSAQQVFYSSDSQAVREILKVLDSLEPGLTDD